MKRIIICADGTWNKPDQIDTGGKRGKNQRRVRKPSNVVKMVRAIKPLSDRGISQVVFYDPGIGTGIGPLDKWAGGITGLGLSRNIMDCYTFLINNYSQGDEIYLFGFSRGAYTVRSLAGFISRCGLLEKDDAYYAIDAYQDIYKKRRIYSENEIKEKMDEVPAWLPAKIRNGWAEKIRLRLVEESKRNDEYVKGFLSNEKKFRNRNHPTREVKIKFLGVWDTVGALGIPLNGPIAKLINKENEFHNVRLSAIVENAFHALAIDELPKPFKPTLWDPDGPLAKGHKMEQVWFIGTHPNIGGGLTTDRTVRDCPHKPDKDQEKYCPYQCPDRQSACEEDSKIIGFSLENYAFKWMVKKATEAGLECEPDFLEHHQEELEGSIRDTFELKYRLLGACHRPIGKTKYGNEFVHESAEIRFKTDHDYKPINLEEYLGRDSKDIHITG